MDRQNHPCFSAGARHRSGRIHLPVAPKCNMQCNYCNRDFACVNESRPGVSSTILTPLAAADYLDAVLEKVKTIEVVGIAGPGDPFANASETLETLRLVRERHPDMMLCLATNGLELAAHAEDIASPRGKPRHNNDECSRSRDREEYLRVGADRPEDLPGN